MVSRPKRAARKDWSWLTSQKAEGPDDDDGLKSKKVSASIVTSDVSAVSRSVNDNKRQRKRKTSDTVQSSVSSKRLAITEDETENDVHDQRHNGGYAKNFDKNVQMIGNSKLRDDECSSKYHINASGFVIDDSDDTFGESSDEDGSSEVNQTSAASKSHRRKSYGKKNQKASSSSTISKHRYESDDEHINEASAVSVTKHAHRSALTEKHVTVLLPKLKIKLTPSASSSSAGGANVTPRTSTITPLSTPESPANRPVFAAPVATESVAYNAATTIPVARSLAKNKRPVNSSRPTKPSRSLAAASSSKQPSSSGTWLADNYVDDADESEIITADSVNQDDESEEEWLEAVEEGDWDKLEKLKTQIIQKSLTARQRAVKANDSLAADDSLFAAPDERFGESFAQMTASKSVTVPVPKQKTAEKRAVDLKKRREQALSDRERQKRGTLSRLLDTTDADSKLTGAGGADDLGPETGAFREKLPLDMKSWQLSSYQYVASAVRTGVPSFYKVPLGAPSPFAPWKPLLAKEIAMCAVCRADPRKYRCPKTGTDYCSVKCYKNIDRMPLRTPDADAALPISVT